MEAFFEIFESGNIIKVEALEFQTFGSGNQYDKNWIKSKITVKAGGFSGEYHADLMTVDFKQFEKQLSTLYDNLSGGAAFHDLEGYLEIRIIGDGVGHFEVNVTADDSPGANSRTLTFSMTIDQTYIKPIVNNLKKITEAFPVKGSFRIN
ncbi:hypothetical protein SAMN05216464_106220 [Mucilaginibacter pineti]|uniref:Uncharacterized protein n=1 Tax=Mucilaginibacter pineti TaxID=1391627 RepID=A0A1G7D335_9SPHI|nr:hypothetical protein [Mucilaginibacter pineti]SDE45978.1 hypothetical protein SAMN05216464_106220 [Mucilaginibacter pineti]